MKQRRRQGRSGKNTSLTFSSSLSSSSCSSSEEMANTDHMRNDKKTPVDLANSVTDMVTCSTEWGKKDDDKEECAEEGDTIVKQRQRQGRSGKNDSSSSSSSLSSFSSSSKEMANTDHMRYDKQTPVYLANSVTDMVTCRTEWGEKDDDKEECTEEGDNIGLLVKETIFKKSTNSNEMTIETPVEKRVRWTEKEKETVIKHFQKYLLLKKLPGKREIQNCIDMEIVLSRRTWRNVKDFI